MTTSLLDNIHASARERGSAIAIQGDHQAMTYRELDTAIAEWADKFDGQVLGLMLDNGPAWICMDLAARRCGMTCVPLPKFFSNEQIRHVMRMAGVDCLVTDQPERIEQIIPDGATHLEALAGQLLYLFQLHGATLVERDTDAAKITFTSGTTGTPKGVCLQAVTQDQVAHAMLQAADATSADRMLSLLPLSTLLENIAVYAGLMAGGCVYLPALSQTGVSMTGIDAKKLCSLVSTVQPNVIVIVPEILRVLVSAADAGWQPPETLRFIAVGGATVSPVLLQQAANRGLPVFQGYGLSEAASVVCLNKPGANRIGSVGKPLPHLQVIISDDGEVLVKGNLFSGYLKDTVQDRSIWPTGDLGHLDDEGYLFLQGRKKNVIVTSFGRNVSPEWVESELTAEPSIGQAVVFGDGRPWCVALIFPLTGATADEIAYAVERANYRLPTYARIKQHYISGRPLSVSAGEVTANGRLRRSMIEENFQTQIEQLYMEKEYAVL